MACSIAMTIARTLFISMFLVAAFAETDVAESTSPAMESVVPEFTLEEKPSNMVPDTEMVEVSEEEVAVHADAAATISFMQQTEGRTERECKSVTDATIKEIKDSISVQQRILDRLYKGQNCHTKGRTQYTRAKDRKKRADEALRRARREVSNARGAKVDFPKFVFNSLTEGQCPQFWRSIVYVNAKRRYDRAVRIEREAVGSVKIADKLVKEAYEAHKKMVRECRCHVKSQHTVTWIEANKNNADHAKAWKKAHYMLCVLRDVPQRRCRVPAVPKVRRVSVASGVNSAKCNSFSGSWSSVQSRRQCINKVQKHGDRRDNPIFGGGGFIGSLTLNDCKKQCTKRKDRHGRRCVAIEWSDSGRRLGKNSRRNCALAWGCDTTSGWGGGSVYKMRKMEFKEKKISEKRTVKPTKKVGLARTIFDSRTVRTFNGRQDKKFRGNQYKITGSYTIQIDAKPTKRTGDWARIFGKGNSGPRNYGLWIARNGTPLAQTYGPAGSNAHGSKVVPLNKWSTFTMVYKKHQYIALYMNGKRISKTTSRSGHPRTDNQPLTIAKASFHTGFIGQLKNAKIWKSALNDGQVKKSYRKPKKSGAVRKLNLKGFKAKQSSTGWGGSPQRAIDGNTEGSYGRGSCTHTHRNNPSSWEVNLKKKYAIDKVVLWNRSDCCTGRLNSAEVYVDKQKCGNLGRAARSNTVKCNGKRGSIVKVQKKNDYLTLCEVQVYAIGKGKKGGKKKGGKKKNKN